MNAIANYLMLVLGTAALVLGFPKVSIAFYFAGLIFAVKWIYELQTKNGRNK